MTQTTSRGCSSPSWHPPFLFQKPPCWAHLWWDNKTLISGWQCASAQGSVSRQTLHGTFPKKMKGKPLCTQNMKETQWISGRLMNFRWTVMRGKTWLVCTILNQGSHREGLFICPDTVRATETILDWTLTHKVHLKYFYCFFCQISLLWESWTSRLLCKAATAINLLYTDCPSTRIVTTRKYCSKLKATCQSTSSAVRGAVSGVSNHLFTMRKLNIVHCTKICAPTIKK